MAAIYQNELAKNTERPEGRELVDNLQEQIDCLKTEKESVVQLWQTSIKTIDTLEEELQLHRNRSEAFVLRTEIEKLKRSYEDRIKVMEQQLADSQKRQNETIQLYSSKLEGKCTEVERLLEEKAHALKKLNELESQLEQLKNRLYEIEKDKRNLENTVKEKDKEILNLQSKLVVSRSKICEAIEVAETALTEKDDALLREAKTKGISFRTELFTFHHSTKFSAKYIYTLK